MVELDFGQLSVLLIAKSAVQAFHAMSAFGLMDMVLNYCLKIRHKKTPRTGQRLLSPSTFGNPN